MNAKARNATTPAGDPIAALDRFTFSVSMRMAGPDAIRRKRLELAQAEVARRQRQKATRADDLSAAHYPPHLIDHLRRLEELASGTRLPETLQDHLDIERMARERAAPSFTEAFWLTSFANLVASGWSDDEARNLIAETRSEVDPITNTQGEHADGEAAY